LFASNRITWQHTTCRSQPMRSESAIGNMIVPLLREPRDQPKSIRQPTRQTPNLQLVTWNL